VSWSFVVRLKLPRTDAQMPRAQDALERPDPQTGQPRGSGFSL